jgi:hypothetical protein
MNGGAITEFPEAEMRDTARMIDYDNDGLVDLFSDQDFSVPVVFGYWIAP